MGKLEKGDSFVLNKKKWEVVSKAKDGSLKINIEGKGNKRLIFKYGDYFGTLGKSVDWFDNYFRDIEGIIIIDLLNAYNPFHEKSIFSKHIGTQFA